MISTRTKSECGRLGGLATFDKYGTGHYAMLARKMHAKYTKEYLRSCARKGGEAYVRRYISGPSYATSTGISATYEDEEPLPL